MAQPTNVQSSFNHYTLSEHEDLLDLMTLASPKETPLLSMLPRVPAKQLLHEWTERTLRSATTTGVVEGDHRAADLQQTPSRRVNYCQIVRRDISITGTKQASDSVGGDWTSTQVMDALSEIALDAEASLIQGSLAGTPQGTAALGRKLQGITKWLNTANGGTVQIAGAAVDSAEIITLLAQIWSAGVSANTILASPALKQVFSAMTEATRIHHDGGVSDPRMIVRNIQTFESDYGTCEIHLSRYVSLANEPHGYAFDRQYLRTAWLRPPMVEELGKRGDSRDVMVLAELTLECLNSKAGGIWYFT